MAASVSASLPCGLITGAIRPPVGRLARSPNAGNAETSALEVLGQPFAGLEADDPGCPFWIDELPKMTLRSCGSSLPVLSGL